MNGEDMKRISDAIVDTAFNECNGDHRAMAFAVTHVAAAIMLAANISEEGATKLFQMAYVSMKEKQQ